MIEMSLFYSKVFAIWFIFQMEDQVFEWKEEQ
jgi:hypothetical protein